MIRSRQTFADVKPWQFAWHVLFSPTLPGHLTGTRSLQKETSLRLPTGAMLVRGRVHRKSCGKPARNPGRPIITHTPLNPCSGLPVPYSVSPEISSFGEDSRNNPRGLSQNSGTRSVVSPPFKPTPAKGHPHKNKRKP